MKTKHIQYQTHGTCSQLIDVTADEHDVIQQVFFLGGCNGNLQGISQLVRGQKIDDVIPRLNGIRCGIKSTSCPDQLCRALEQLKQAPVAEEQTPPNQIRNNINQGSEIVITFSDPCDFFFTFLLFYFFLETNFPNYI